MVFYGSRVDGVGGCRRSAGWTPFLCGVCEALGVAARRVSTGSSPGVVVKFVEPSMELKQLSSGRGKCGKLAAVKTLASAATDGTKLS